ncbi:hypothetical protein COOONC_23137 [Cooperia oncophora]
MDFMPFLSASVNFIQQILPDLLRKKVQFYRHEHARAVPARRFGGKRFRSSEKLEWSSHEARKELTDILGIPGTSAQEWRTDPSARLGRRSGGAHSESLEDEHRPSCRFSSEFPSHRSFSSSSSSSEPSEEIGQEIQIWKDAKKCTIWIR